MRWNIHSFRYLLRWWTSLSIPFLLLFLLQYMRCGLLAVRMHVVYLPRMAWVVAFEVS
jgi:hypothetical protein